MTRRSGSLPLLHRYTSFFPATDALALDATSPASQISEKTSRKLNWLCKLNWAAQKDHLSEAEADMDKRNWEQRNLDVALYETGRELESERLELRQANQLADQARIHFCGELELFQTEEIGIAKNLLRRNG